MVQLVVQMPYQTSVSPVLGLKHPDLPIWEEFGFRIADYGMYVLCTYLKELRPLTVFRAAQLFEEGVLGGCQ